MNNDVYESRPGQSLPSSAKLQERDILSARRRFELIGYRCLVIIATTLMVCHGVVNAAPTPIPTLTATNGSLQLGQPLTNFVKTYGQPEQTEAGSYTFRQDTVEVDTNPKSLVIDITDRNTTDKGWANIDEAAKACEAYMPKDAKFQKTVNNPAETFEGKQSPPFTTRFYTSPSLAALFQAKDFVDSEDKPVPPGTFSIAYDNADTKSQRIEDCYMEIGAVTK